MWPKKFFFQKKKEKEKKCRSSYVHRFLHLLHHPHHYIGASSSIETKRQKNHKGEQA
jgi:hypothetical protein